MRVTQTIAFYERKLRALQRATKKRKGFRVGAKTARALLCARFGVKNTGRQWKRLRRALKREKAER